MKENESQIEAQYTLLNSSNFYKILKSSFQELLEKYVSLILEYSKYILEKVSIKNKKYQEFIFNRGLDTISHVFLMILFYTKSIDMAYYHSQKSFYYYVEYIEQISMTNNQLVQLNSRDASIFVYKKTIYEINSDYRKSQDIETENKNEKIDMLSLFIEMYKQIFSFPKELFIEIHQFIISHLIHRTDLKNVLNIMYLFFEKMKENEWDKTKIQPFLNKLKNANTKLLNQMSFQIINEEILLQI